MAKVSFKKLDEQAVADKAACGPLCAQVKAEKVDKSRRRKILAKKFEKTLDILAK